MIVPRLTGAVPTLASLSFEETVRFYGQLGFEIEFRDVEVMSLMRDDVRIHFWLTGNRRVPQSTSCWIEVSGIDALYEAILPLGVLHRKGQLESKPWGAREFHVVDCHGNLIRFAERQGEPA